MINTHKFILLILLITIRLGQSNPDDNRDLAPAPTFYAKTLRDEDFFLSHYISEISAQNEGTRALVFIFFTTSCLPCRQEIPLMMSLRPNFPKLDFYLINIAEDKNIVNKFMQEMQYNLPVLLDPYGIISEEKYKIKAAPAVVIISKAGQLLHKNIGLPHNPEKYYKELFDTLFSSNTKNESCNE